MNQYANGFWMTSFVMSYKLTTSLLSCATTTPTAEAQVEHRMASLGNVIRVLSDYEADMFRSWYYQHGCAFAIYL